AVVAGSVVGHRGPVGRGPGLVAVVRIIDARKSNGDGERDHEPAPGGGEAADRQTAALLPAFRDLDQGDDAEDEGEQPGEVADRGEDAEDQRRDRERVRPRLRVAVRPTRLARRIPVPGRTAGRLRDLRVRLLTAGPLAAGLATVGQLSPGLLSLRLLGLRLRSVGLVRPGRAGRVPAGDVRALPRPGWGGGGGPG